MCDARDRREPVEISRVKRNKFRAPFRGINPFFTTPAFVSRSDIGTQALHLGVRPALMKSGRHVFATHFRARADCAKAGGRPGADIIHRLWQCLDWKRWVRFLAAESYSPKRGAGGE